MSLKKTLRSWVLYFATCLGGCVGLNAQMTQTVETQMTDQNFAIINHVLTAETDAPLNIQIIIDDLATYSDVYVNGTHYSIKTKNGSFWTVERLKVICGSGADSITVFGNHEKFMLFFDTGSGNDRIEFHGAVSSDAILGDGDDQYYGSFYDGIYYSDRVFGGPGNDIIEGRAGSNVLNGGPDNDDIWGHNGNDDLSGGEGDDVLRGGNGNDQIYGNEGVDHLYGGPGADELWGSHRHPYNWGFNPGPDYQTDVLTGGTGPDSFHSGFYTFKTINILGWNLIYKSYVDQDTIVDFDDQVIWHPDAVDTKHEYYVPSFILNQSWFSP